MKNRIFAASYERGSELIAAGCPLDYPGALARHSAAQRKTFRAQQLGGYAESRIYAISELQTGYLIGLRLETERPSGTIISAWSFEPPWQDHMVIWDYEPLDIIPDGQLGAYRDLLDSRLTGVLNERRLFRRAIRSKACCAVVQVSRLQNRATGSSTGNPLWLTIKETRSRFVSP